MRIYTVEDINIQEVELKAKYYDLFFEGQIQEAHKIIENNPNLRNKVLNSEYLNLIIGNIIELENYYFNNVEDVLSKHLSDYKINITDLIYLNNFNPSVQYKKNNFVLYKEDIYFCIKDTFKNVFPDNERYWIKLSNLKGKPSPVSLGINYKGKWSNINNYQKNEMVVFDNKLYVSKTNDNKNKIPPNNLNDWALSLKIENSGIIVSKTPPPYLNIGSIWLKIL